MVGRSAVPVLGSVVLLMSAPAYTQQQPPRTSQTQPAADPNQKVCENITATGSRLATKRFCGTRAEWEDRKRQDREAVEKAQSQPCMPDVPGCQ
jgi:hypothetical protein